MNVSFYDALSAPAAAWLPTMLRACWHGALAVALVWISCRVFGARLPALWRPWLWRAAFLKTLLTFAPLPLLLLPLLPQREIAAPVSATIAVSVAPPKVQSAKNLSQKVPGAARFIKSRAASRIEETSSAVGATSLAASLVAAPKNSASATPLSTNVASTHAPLWPRVLFQLWLVGLLANLFFLARDGRRAAKLRSAASPLHDEEIEAVLKNFCRRLRIGRAPQLLRARENGPLLLGLLCPAIVLPETSMREYSHEEMRLILAHETAHWRRRDLAWNSFAALTGAIFWFHPLLWLARHEHHLSSEEACDALALRLTKAAPSDYGALLLRVASRESKAMNAAAAVGVADFASLQRRLLALRNARRPSRRAARRMAAALLVAAVIGLVPWRLTARAQAENATTVAASSEAATLQEKKTPPREISGRVLGPGDKPIGGATVYVMRIFRNDEAPLARIVTDARGNFRVREPKAAFTDAAPGWETHWAQLVVDAGARGLWHRTVDFEKGGEQIVRVPPPATLHLTFLDERDRPAKNLGVSLRRLGPDRNSWISLPPQILKRFRGRTDARGRITFPSLPQGLVAQLALDDEKTPRSELGDGDVRGGRYAPLASEDDVRLVRKNQSRTIHLETPVVVNGSIKFGTSGKPVANSRVLARRINAAEARGEKPIDYHIASTFTNAQGRYQLKGLRPGNYVMWTWPDKKIKHDWTSVNPEVTLRSGKVNRVDFTLIKGAMIEGKVVSARTGKPVARQTMGLFDAEENYQYDTSRGDGSFRFRVVGGKQHLWVHQNAASPPPGFMLPAQKDFNFSVANGKTYRITIRLPVAASGAIKGRVLDENGKPLSGAQISVEGLGGMHDYETRAVLKSDAGGRFTFSPQKSSSAVRFWARAENRMSPRGTIALPGDNVTLRVQRNVAVTIGGRVLASGSKKPLAGALVRLYRYSGNVGSSNGETRTGADGRFRFTDQTPTGRYAVNAILDGYFASRGELMLQPKAGEEKEVTIELRRAASFIAGRVLNADGKPAAGLQVSASGANKPAITDSKGHFRFPHVLSGKVAIYVSRHGNGPDWSSFQVTAGRADVVLKLPRISETNTAWKVEQEKSKQQQRDLIGQIAPELTTEVWANSPPLSLKNLRGQIILLSFFTPYVVQPEIDEIAKQFAERGVRVIGVVSILRGRGLEGKVDAARLREMARANMSALAQRNDISYPLARDVKRSGSITKGFSDISDILGVTTMRYGASAYVVIDRSGHIIYAGDSLGEAMRAIGGLLAKP